MINSTCPSSPPPRPPCVNPDWETLLTWKLAQSYFAMLQRKLKKIMVENYFKNWSYRDDNVTNYINFFEKLCEKRQLYTTVYVKASTSSRKIERISLSTNQYCAMLVCLQHYNKAIYRLRKKWWIIELKSANYSLETEKFFCCTLSRLQSNF